MTTTTSYSTIIVALALFGGSIQKPAHHTGIGARIAPYNPLPDPFAADLEAKFKGGDYNYVIQEYLSAKSGKVPNLLPDSLDKVAHILAVSYDRTGKILESLPYYKESFGTYFPGDNRAAVCHYGDLNYIVGDFAEAKRAYEGVIAIGPCVPPPRWPSLAGINMRDYPENWTVEKTAKVWQYEAEHPAPYTPLDAPKPVNPTMNQARAAAYYLVAQRETYTPSYLEGNIAYYKIAERLWPDNPVIHWRLATALHATGEDKSAFIEYDLAEKYATGQVEKAIHELRDQDRMAVIAPTWVDDGKVLHKDWKTWTANDFKDWPRPPIDYDKLLDLPKRVDPVNPRLKNPQ